MANQAERAALAAQVQDLREEGNELYRLLVELDDDDWSRVTAFRDWSIYDVVAHLHLSDHMGTTSLQGLEPFKALMRDMAAARLPMAGYARRWLGRVPGAELRERWYTLLGTLCDGLAAADPEERLAWVGPGMKPRMFATARQMETWAHGWELYDLLGLPRTHWDRLHNIATIGVRTFGWTFSNRKLEVPATVPHVRLIAPSGAIWTWHEPDRANQIVGDAVEFCQVVTQVRNVADTALTVTGEVAERWMTLAQCFAGPAVDPPAPGSRIPARARL